MLVVFLPILVAKTKIIWCYNFIAPLMSYLHNKHLQKKKKKIDHSIWDFFMLQFGNLCSKFLKTNVRFEISTFKVVHMRNFVKIRTLILFGPKYPDLAIWLQNFWKPMSNLKASRKFDISPILKFWNVSGLS